MGDVANINHRAVDLLDRNVVDRGDGVGTAVETNDEFVLGNFCCASRQCQVLRINCVADIERRETFRQQRLRIEIDHDLPRLAAIRKR